MNSNSSEVDVGALGKRETLALGAGDVGSVGGEVHEHVAGKVLCLSWRSAISTTSWLAFVELDFHGGATLIVALS